MSRVCWTCKAVIKYRNDPHNPTCRLAYPEGPPPEPKPKRCICGNEGDKECVTDAHSDWCRKDNA